MDRTGQLGFVTSAGFFPWLIRTGTASPFNHVVVGISATKCIGAEPDGAAIRPISYFTTKTTSIIWSRIPESPDEASIVAAWARAHEHTPYNLLDDIAIGLGVLLRWQTPQFIEDRLARTDRLQCAQLADDALSAAGIHLFTNRPNGAVTPGSLARELTRRGWGPTGHGPGKLKGWS